jgi:hypothetical protein
MATVFGDQHPDVRIEGLSRYRSSWGSPGLSAVHSLGIKKLITLQVTGDDADSPMGQHMALPRL